MVCPPPPCIATGILRPSGSGTNASGVDDRAISWLRKPRTIARIGAIAVMPHHIGIVKGFDKRGNPILISGNHGHKVGIGAYPRGRILAYVTP